MICRFPRSASQSPRYIRNKEAIPCLVFRATLQSNRLTSCFIAGTVKTRGHMLFNCKVAGKVAKSGEVEEEMKIEE